MSFAMDDLGNFQSLGSTLKAGFIEETRMVEKTTDVKETDSFVKQEPEIEDAYKTSKHNLDEFQQSIENFQEKYINSSEESEDYQDAIKKSIEESYNKIRLQNSITINTNSIVEIERTPQEEELKPTEPAPTPEVETNKPEKLKESVIEEIKQSPAKSREIHIKHLDRDLLLAMISLRLG